MWVEICWSWIKLEFMQFVGIIIYLEDVVHMVSPSGYKVSCPCHSKFVWLRQYEPGCLKFPSSVLEDKLCNKPKQPIFSDRCYHVIQMFHPVSKVHRPQFLCFLRCDEPYYKWPKYLWQLHPILIHSNEPQLVQWCSCKRYDIRLYRPSVFVD